LKQRQLHKSLKCKSRCALNGTVITPPLGAIVTEKGKVYINYFEGLVLIMSSCDFEARLLFSEIKEFKYSMYETPF
jgi:hypothetical protein